jgi:hypothetical protein
VAGPEARLRDDLRRNGTGNRVQAREERGGAPARDEGVVVSARDEGSGSRFGEPASVGVTGEGD